MYVSMYVCMHNELDFGFPKYDLQTSFCAAIPSKKFFSAEIRPEKRRPGSTTLCIRCISMYCMYAYMYVCIDSKTSKFIFLLNVCM